MLKDDPNRALLVRVAQALEDLQDRIAFVGGSSVGLLLTDAAAAGVRPTVDVDVIVKATGYMEYQDRVGGALRARGFRVCTDEDAPLCRWVLDDVRVDVMPTDEQVQGFSNPWYGPAIQRARPVNVDGTVLRLVTAPDFLATKIVAFLARGQGD